MNQSPTNLVIRAFKDRGVRWVLSVPCKALDRLLTAVEADPDLHHLPLTREEEGIGLAAGLYLGGQMTALLLQNSGLGNGVNALMSLTRLYRLPLVMVVSHRGLPGERIGAQTPMGRITPDLLRLAGVYQETLSSAADLGRLGDLIDHARVSERPVAALIPPRTWEAA
jgi:sulfopyruvate decarboxylase subunit alpha